MLYVAIMVLAATLEIGWVTSVRFVNNNSVFHLAMAAMVMQTISFSQTLILVNNNLTMLAGILGSGIGAVIVMRIPQSWFNRSNK